MNESPTLPPRFPLQSFGDAVMGVVRQMDDEASGQWNDLPTGLNFYGGHFRPQLKKPPTETSWTRRLEQLLPLVGFPARREFRYPHSEECCDSLVMMDDGSTMWLETKGAWKKYWQDKRKEGTYWSYLLHPLVSGLGAKDHTAALDLCKLSALRRPHADHIGLLLLGFDADSSPMDADVDRFVDLARLSDGPWSSCSASWSDCYRPGCGVKAWLWHRPVAGLDADAAALPRVPLPTSAMETEWSDYQRAARVFKWFLDAEIMWGRYFYWETPIAHVLRQPMTSEFVAKAGAAVRQAERQRGKYNAMNYLDPARFAGLLECVRDTITDGVRERGAKTWEVQG